MVTKRLLTSVLLAAYCLVFCGQIFGKNERFRLPIQIYSPDGRLHFQVSNSDGNLSYSLDFEGKEVIASSKLGLDFLDGSFGKNLKITHVRIRKKVEDYTLVVGKTSHVKERFCEANIKIETTDGPNRFVILWVRVFNDGVGFRYEFPKQKNWQSYELTEERTEFRFPLRAEAHALLLPNYRTSHEGLYSTMTVEAIPTDTLVDVPALFRLDDHLFVSITEAALRDFAGMYLQKSTDGTLQSRLSPLPGQEKIKVKATLPHCSPWRVIMVAERIGTLIESNILTNLNEPCQIKDLSWIKPGKATWSWWNGDIIKNVDFPVGLNFQTQQYYIDFCAENNIEYHSIIEHGNHAWYFDTSEGFDPPPPGADVTRPVDSLEMERLAAYSRQKGVGLRVWVHWKPLSEKLEAAFSLYEKWNIQGLMVDFMDRDDQEMINWQEKVLQTAAKYHLHVQFHGVCKPTGLSRTWPNEFTREGVLNLENLKWSKECDPEHNLNIPFTRMLAGPTDYHAGGFRSVPKAAYKASFYEPNVMGTRCHHIALYVVFESYLQLVSDFPQAYIGQSGFDFVRDVPTVWDQTKVLDAEIGKHITVARRKGEDWYIGTMNDWTPRTINFSLRFLPPGEYSVEMWSDSPEGDSNPNLLVQTNFTAKNTDNITAVLAAGGGQALRVKRVLKNK